MLTRNSMNKAESSAYFLLINIGWDLGFRGWALTTTLLISTLLKNALSKVSFSNLFTNDFLDHPKASGNFLFLHV